jgi:hypothetical protein
MENPKEKQLHLNLEVKKEPGFRLINDEEFIYLRDKYHIGPGLTVFVLGDQEGDEKYRVNEPKGQTIAEWKEEQDRLDEGLKEKEDYRTYHRR